MPAQRTFEKVETKEVEITAGDFDVAAEYAAICAAAPKSGAVVLFVGLVRDLYDDENEQHKIDYLELSHYAGMTERLCQQIIDQARQDYSIDAVRLIHRVGKLYANQQIVLLAVASRHREHAYNASRLIMDYLKTQATLWKKEVGSRGEQWLGIKQTDRAAAERWQASKLHRN